MKLLSALTRVFLIFTAIICVANANQPFKPLSTNLLWSTPTHEPMLFPIASQSGIYFTGKNTGVLYSYDTGGNLIHAYKETPQSPNRFGRYSKAVIGPDNTVYIVNNYMIVAMRQDSSIIWTLMLNKNQVDDYAALALDPNSGTLYAVLNQWSHVGSTLVAIRAIDGSTLWNINLGSTYEYNSVPLVGKDGTVYISTLGQIFAVKDGDITWVYRRTDNDFSMPVQGSNGTLYVRMINKNAGSVINVVALQPKNGREIWRLKTPAQSADGIQLSIGSDDTLYFAASANGLTNNELYALKSDKNVQWVKTANQDLIATSPVVGPNGTIYIVGNEISPSTLTALNSDGSVKWSSNEKIVLRSGIYSSNPSNIVIGENGTIYAGGEHAIYAYNP